MHWFHVLIPIAWSQIIILRLGTFSDGDYMKEFFRVRDLVNSYSGVISVKDSFIVIVNAGPSYIVL